MKRVINHAKNPKILFIVALVIALTLLIKFSGISFAKVQPFDIDDKCGQFVNLFSHTIEDEETCDSRCKSLCISKDLDFQNVNFKTVENACNSCTCFCR